MAFAESTYDLIVGFEGKRYRAYKDSKGLWTTGIGHLIKPNEQYLITKVLSEGDVKALFDADAQWCKDTIDDAIIVPLTQNQYDALFSLCFNIGKEHFENSTVLRRLNLADFTGAANHFLDWCKPPELLTRRQKEKALFLGA
jgi:lysozyme